MARDLRGIILSRALVCIHVDTYSRNLCRKSVLCDLSDADFAEQPRSGPRRSCRRGIRLHCASVPVSNVYVSDANGHHYTASPHSPFTTPLNSTRNTATTYFFYLLNAPSNASKTIYISWTTGIDAVAWADEFSSSAGTSSFDTDIGATDTHSGTAINFPSITPAGSNELLYALTLPYAVTAPAAGRVLGRGLELLVA